MSTSVTVGDSNGIKLILPGQFPSFPPGKLNVFLSFDNCSHGFVLDFLLMLLNNKDNNVFRNTAVWGRMKEELRVSLNSYPGIYEPERDSALEDKAGQLLKFCYDDLNKDFGGNNYSFTENLRHWKMQAMTMSDMIIFVNGDLSIGAYKNPSHEMEIVQAVQMFRDKTSVFCLRGHPLPVTAIKIDSEAFYELPHLLRIITERIGGCVINKKFPNLKLV